MSNTTKTSPVSKVPTQKCRNIFGELNRSQDRSLLKVEPRSKSSSPPHFPLKLLAMGLPKRICIGCTSSGDSSKMSVTNFCGDAISSNKTWLVTVFFGSQSLLLRPRIPPLSLLLLLLLSVPSLRAKVWALIAPFGLILAPIASIWSVLLVPMALLSVVTFCTPRPRCLMAVTGWNAGNTRHSRTWLYSKPPHFPLWPGLTRFCLLHFWQYFFPDKLGLLSLM